MDLSHAAWLAFVQGLLEFLPVSSSGHLILVPALLGWPDQGLAFDVAVHFGTLLAVLTYFRRDLWRMTRAFAGSLAGRGIDADARLAWGVLVGTVPIGVAGLSIGDWVETALRSPLVIAATTAGFGILLWVADRWAPQERDEHGLHWRDVLVIGCAQAIALVPGTSRSGITITAGRLVGLTRTGAARFSFLLAIPAIVLATGYQLFELEAVPGAVDWPALGLGTMLAAITAYLCIDLFLRLVERWGLGIFALYRVALAAVLVVVFT